MELKNKIESILFVSGAPLDAGKIAKILDAKKDDVEIFLQNLALEYKKDNKGIRIAEVEGKYQMVTTSQNSEEVQNFLKQEVLGELTRPQLETLTIVAYRGPIGKMELEQIRGVNCTLILRNLMMRGLIEIADGGEFEKYIITHDFLKFLGVESVKELPDYEKLNANQNLADLLKRTEGDTGNK